jgi:hypothetical protein
MEGQSSSSIKNEFQICKEKTHRSLMRILDGDQKRKFIKIYNQLLALPYLQIEQCFRKNGIIAGEFASYVSGKTNAYGDIDIFIPQTSEALEDVDGSLKRVEYRRPFINNMRMSVRKNFILEIHMTTLLTLHSN